MYRHTGFWQCMDTLRDAQALNSLGQRQRPVVQFSILICGEGEEPF